MSLLPRLTIYAITYGGLGVLLAVLHNLIRDQIGW